VRPKPGQTLAGFAAFALARHHGRSRWDAGATGGARPWASSGSHIGGGSSALGFWNGSFEAEPICFSSAASFTAAAVLLPLGALAIRQTHRRRRPELLPLALMPVLFGLQQAIEGLVWLALGAGWTQAGLRPLALAYLFFAFFLWPSWLPLVALTLSRGRLGSWRRNLLRALTLAGVLLGLVLWLPLLLEPARLSIAVQGHSMVYSARLLFSGDAGNLGRALYLLLVLLPLLLLPSPRLWLFSFGLLAAGLLAEGVAHHAFTSVWCFFSALLSGWILWLVSSEPVMPQSSGLPAGRPA